MCCCVFDVIMFVLSCSALCSNHSATMDIFKIAIGELIMSFRILPAFIIYPQIPSPIFSHSVPLDKFILLLRGRSVFAPRIPLVEYELALLDKSLGMVVCPVVQFDGHDVSPPLSSRDRSCGCIFPRKVAVEPLACQ